MQAWCQAFWLLQVCKSDEFSCLRRDVKLNQHLIQPGLIVDQCRTILALSTTWSIIVV
jgi:hypothetical protein